MELILLILSQLVFSFCRTLNVRYVSRDMVLQSLITSLVIKVTWLMSTYIGVNAMINKEVITVISYVVFGVLGDYLSFKIKLKKT